MGGGNLRLRISLAIVLLFGLCVSADAQPIEAVAPPTDPALVEEHIVSEETEEVEGDEVVDFADYFERHPIYESIYDAGTDAETYLPGNGDDFGWISLEGKSSLDANESFGFTSQFSMHWLSGPDRTDLPPRVYDLVWGIQMRDRVGHVFAYDLAANFGIFADFEDSVRQGIRFPGHAVGFLNIAPRAQIVFGVDYLGHDDIRVLPVFGIHLKSYQPLFDAELIFPRPKLSLILNAKNKLYVAGNIGGGTWDIERPDESNDVFTYRDHRVVIGMESLDDEDGSRSALEFGFSFNRELSFRDDPLEMDLDQAFFIRFTSTD